MIKNSVLRHAAVILVLAGLGAGLLLAGGPEPGDDAVRFTLFALNCPERINLKKYFNTGDDAQDRVVLLTFFASWCKPCKKELPHLEEVYQANKDKGLEIMAVFSEKDSTAWAKKYWEGNGLTYLLLNDEYGIVKKRYEIAEYPTSFLIGTDGKVVRKFTGFDETVQHQTDSLVTALVK